jgi:NhaP-type Na+/H+ or K+/H+ antiporter
MSVFGLLAYFSANNTFVTGVMMNPGLATFIFFIIQGKYNWYNLSIEGRVASSATFAFLAKAVDATCFCFIGLSVYQTLPGFWSWSLIWGLMPFVIIGRVVAVLILFYGFALCFRTKRLDFKEILYIIWAGMVRGSVTFATAVNMPRNCPGEYRCLEQKYYELGLSTTVFITSLTTVFFGTFMRAVNQILFQPKPTEEIELTQSFPV